MARALPRIMEGLAYTSPAHWLRPAEEPREHPAREWYKTLKAYYLNNDLYHAVQSALEDLGYWQESMRPLRNPAYRTVEFYVAKLWPGNLPDALPLQTDNDALIDPIQQLWVWSNWAAQKQVCARWLAMYGDLFLKVATHTNSAGEVDQVYWHKVYPGSVIDFDTDHRDFITWIRIDTPRRRRMPDGVESVIHTEIWDKRENSFRVWQHDKGVGADLERLGDADEAAFITDRFGVDFIPFVHVKKLDIGDEDENADDPMSGRGVAAITPAIHKIDEANRQATRLHQMLFRHNRVEKAVESDATTPDGRPLPAPKVEGEAGDKIEVGDEQFWKLPSGWHIKNMVPDINYAAALEVLNAQMMEIEADLPELAYYRILQDANELSGVALDILTGPAQDRVREARGNAEAGLVRAEQMALTLAQTQELSGFEEGLIGTFEAGDFEHAFEERDVIEIGEVAQAQRDKGFAVAGLLWQQLGVSRETVLAELGFDPIQEAQRRQDQSDRLGEGLLAAAEGLAATDRGQ